MREWEIEEVGEGMSAQRGRKTGLEGEDRADHSLASSRRSQLLDPEASTWRTEVVVTPGGPCATALLSSRGSISTG